MRPDFCRSMTLSPSPYRGRNTCVVREFIRRWASRGSVTWSAKVRVKKPVASIPWRVTMSTTLVCNAKAVRLAEGGNWNASVEL